MVDRLRVRGLVQAVCFRLMAPRMPDSSDASFQPGSASYELNRDTAQFGNWVMKAMHSDILEYTYYHQGQKRTNYKLRVVLTAAQEGQRCLGYMRSNKFNRKELEEALRSKWVKGNVYRFSKVYFLDEKQQYVYTQF